MIFESSAYYVEAKRARGLVRAKSRSRSWRLPAGETVTAQGTMRAVPRRVCCVCRVVDCCELLSWEQVIHANTTSAWWTVERGFGCVLHSMQGGERAVHHHPPPRNGPALVFGLYGNPG